MSPTSTSSSTWSRLNASFRGCPLYADVSSFPARDRRTSSMSLGSASDNPTAPLLIRSATVRPPLGATVTPSFPLQQRRHPVPELRPTRFGAAITLENHIEA